MRSIKYQIAGVVLGAIFLLAAGVSFIIYRGLQDQATALLTQKLQGDLHMSMALLERQYPGRWRVQGDRLYKGDMMINGNDELVDSLSRLTGDSHTVFLGDLRIATTVKKEDGSRAVGTRATAGVVDRVLKQGQVYLGEAMVVGRPYQTAYLPIRDDQGNNIGMLYAGVSREEVQRQIFRAFGRMLVVVVSTGLLIGLFINWLIVRWVVRPIQLVVGAVEKLG
ncbi:MAG: cache domain-containing protein [Desulfurispora sp.]|uniref:cache domain-containing protein n=1 Tax=Desulfurispora sp. TaxID=3014275 RepID=UPI00404949D9